MRVYRLHIRPKGGLADPVRSFEYCLREQVLGVGWRVDPPAGAALTWQQYEALAIRKHGSDSRSQFTKGRHHGLRVRGDQPCKL
jgi:hypothetical protein